MLIKSFLLTGDGNTHTFQSVLYPSLPPSTVVKVKWMQGVNIGASMRIGGNEVTSLVGYPVSAIGSGGGQFLPPVSELTDGYDLSGIYYYLAIGDSCAGLLAY